MKKIVVALIAIAVLLGLAVGAYMIALKVNAPEPAQFAAWGGSVDEALASAAGSGRLVLVKIGSDW